MDAIEELRPVSLDEVDRRASLLRRVDTKFVVKVDAAERLFRELADDHDVLTIDGRRRFGYESVYFDTPQLRCFRDHIEGCKPRFKARTRHYRDSGKCVFEVKLKLADGETDKRQVDQAVTDRAQLTERAARLVADALPEIGLEPVLDLRPVLRTRFDRITLAAREGGARLTCDVDVRLTTFGGAKATMRRDLVLVESKSSDGRAAADRALERLGAEPLDLSKYRTGIGLLLASDSPEKLAQARRLFER
jgi:VTC domain